MDTHSKIQMHETAIDILKAIESYECRIVEKEHSIWSYGDVFPDLKKNIEHDIDIYKRSIQRLKKRYERIINPK